MKEVKKSKISKKFKKMIFFLITKKNQKKGNNNLLFFSILGIWDSTRALQTSPIMRRRKKSGKI